MFSQKMEEYLDGAVTAQERVEIEAAMARDPQLARLMTGAKSRRALRAAAFESYQPTTQEAHALAEQLFAEAHHAPVGRIGLWVRRGAAVAAALAIVTGAFMAGRTSAPTQIVTPGVETVTVYKVFYMESGMPMVSQFTSEAESNEFMQKLAKEGVPNYAVADLIIPGHM